MARLALQKRVNGAVLAKTAPDDLAPVVDTRCLGVVVPCRHTEIGETPAAPQCSMNEAPDADPAGHLS